MVRWYKIETDIFAFLSQLHFAFMKLTCKNVDGGGTAIYKDGRECIGVAFKLDRIG